MNHDDHRRERVVLETERHRITGLLTLARDGYRSRVSDLLNANERDFVALTEVSVQDLDTGDTREHQFMAISRRHIVLAFDEAR